MKNLITIFILFVAVGCGKNPVVGIYEGKDGEVTMNALAIFGNGKVEFATSQWIVEGEWKVVGDELQLHPDEGGIMLLKIEGSRDLTWNVSTEDQRTFKKLNE